jgi:twitching motility protein PilI
MTDSSPFAVLSAIAARSLEVADDLPLRENAQTHWNGLGFNLLGQRFVAPMSEVAELMRLPPQTRLPGVKPFVTGVANVRGRLMAILDLAGFFGQSSVLPRAQRRVLAVEDEELYFGFMIDESLGMQHFPSDAYSEDVKGVDEIFKPYVTGGYTIGGSVWPVLSLSKLAADPSLEKLAVEA